MRTPEQALAFLEQQRANGSTAWRNRCESLQRQAYGLPAHYPSAEAHARAIPAAFRHGHEQPRRGDLVLYLNGRYGHIVTATGHGWTCYTNDYGGAGRVTKADARDLVRWCGASSWFVADPWWSSSNYRRTHTTEDDNVALSQDDVEKIADAVWAKAIRSSWSGQNMGAASMLAQAHFYALQAGIIGSVPPAATTGAGSRTTAGRIMDTQPGGAGASSDPDVIADAVAAELGRRLDS